MKLKDGQIVSVVFVQDFLEDGYSIKAGTKAAATIDAIDEIAKFDTASCLAGVHIDLESLSNQAEFLVTV